MHKTLLVICVLLLTALASASTAADNNQSSSPQAVRTYMLPDLTLQSVITFDVAADLASAAQAEQPGTPPRKRGFCRCSCGFPCATDKDCGGASCDAFITCCARGPEGSSKDWFTSPLAQSSRKYAVPAVLLKVNCK